MSTSIETLKNNLKQLRTAKGERVLPLDHLALCEQVIKEHFPDLNMTQLDAIYTALQGIGVALLVDNRMDLVEHMENLIHTAEKEHDPAGVGSNNSRLLVVNYAKLLMHLFELNNMIQVRKI